MPDTGGKCHTPVFTTFVQDWPAHDKNVKIAAALWTQSVFQPRSGSPERSFHNGAALTVAIHGLREKLTISSWMKDGFACPERILMNLFTAFHWCHCRNTLCCLQGAHWCFAVAPREAWKALGDTSPHQAMQEYVAAVKKLDPSWNPQVGNVEILLTKQTRIVFGKLTVVQLLTGFNCCMANFILSRLKSKFIFKTLLLLWLKHEEPSLSFIMIFITASACTGLVWLWWSNLFCSYWFMLYLACKDTFYPFLILLFSTTI